MKKEQQANIFTIKNDVKNLIFLKNTDLMSKKKVDSLRNNVHC